MPQKRVGKAKLLTTKTQVVPRNLKSSKSLKKRTEGSDIIKALQENNASLAAALDECRQDFRDLRGEFVVLQGERLQLLERVYSLESKLTEQQKIISEQVEPVLDLLKQSEKTLLFAQQHLTTFFTTKSSSGCNGQLFSPFLSPIPGTAKSHSNTSEPHSSTFIKQTGMVRVKNEMLPQKLPLHTTSNKGKTRQFPKTPHPMQDIKLSSTPEWETEEAEPFVCEPQAINFDLDETAIAVNQAADTPLAASVEPQDLLIEFKAATNASLMGEGCHSEVEVGEKKGLVSVGVRQRPRRTCNSLNISYQDPSLKSKLRSSDLNTTGSLSTKNDHPQSSKLHTESNLSTMTTKLKEIKEGLQVDHDTYREESISFDDLVSLKSVRQRPRRACSVLNISYQEPDLKGKLRRGSTPNTARSIVACENKGITAKSKSNKTRPKSILRDVTNKKH